MSKSSSKQYFTEVEREKKVSELTIALEHQIYRRIPGTNNSYRGDSPNTHTQTQRHAMYTQSKMATGNRFTRSILMEVGMMDTVD